jgi:hypothetical protein
VDRVSRQFINRDGQVIATLDEEGYLTESVLNASGKVYQTIRHSQAVAASLRQTGELGDIQNNIRSSQQDQLQVTTYLYSGIGQLTGVIDAEGYLTVSMTVPGI